MSITVNGQPVPVHASRGQVVALFPLGVLGLRDPTGLSVLPNSDGSIDFTVQGDYCLPAYLHGMGYGAPAHDSGGQWGPQSLVANLLPQSARKSWSPHRPSVPQSISPGRAASPVLLTPAHPDSIPRPNPNAQQSTVSRSKWNTDTCVDHDDPELIYDKFNPAMGKFPHRYNGPELRQNGSHSSARARYRYRPQAEEAASPPPHPERVKGAPGVRPRVYAQGIPQRAHTPPVTSGRRSASPPPRASRIPPPRRETPPLNMMRYMELKYGFNALADDALNVFPRHKFCSSEVPEKRMDLFSQPHNTDKKISQLDDGPSSRLIAFISAEKTNVPTSKGLWRTLPKDVNLLAYSVP